MIDVLASNLPIAAGTIGALALARYVWAAQRIAGVARVLAIVLVLVGLGGAAGVVDLGRLVDLITGLAGVNL